MTIQSVFCNKRYRLYLFETRTWVKGNKSWKKKRKFSHQKKVPLTPFTFNDGGNLWFLRVQFGNFLWCFDTSILSFQDNTIEHFCSISIDFNKIIFFSTLLDITIYKYASHVTSTVSFYIISKRKMQVFLSHIHIINSLFSFLNNIRNEYVKYVCYLMMIYSLIKANVS